MASSPTSSGGKTDPEAVLRLFGADPWLRFDLWSARAWEASEAAIAVATANGPPMGSDDGLDTRIISMFHAAEVAKDFAEMVNPVGAIFGEDDDDESAVKKLNSTLDMIGDNEEQ